VDNDQAGLHRHAHRNEMTQALDTNLEAGKAYRLSAAVAHSYGYAPAPTDAVQIAMYYLDDADQRQMIRSRTIFNDTAAALSATHFNDFSTDFSVPLAPNDRRWASRSASS